MPPAPEPNSITPDSFEHAGLFRVKSEYNTLVSGAARNPLAVKIFKQRNGVFAGNAGELLESGHRDSLALRLLELGDFLAHFVKGAGVENQFHGDALELLFAQENLQQFFCALRFDGQLRKHLFYGGTAKPAFAKADSI